MHGLEILLPTVSLLTAGFLVIFTCRLLRVSPIVGFLLAGIWLGPHGLEVIEDNETTSMLAELGVVFLLFDIGLHFSVKSVKSLRRDLLGLGPLQLGLSGLVLGFIMSVVFGATADVALLVGLTLALSSTAVVMQMVADLKQTESPVGQSAKAVLIFQDLAAIFLLIFADTMGDSDPFFTTVVSTTGKTVLAFFIAVALGQYVLTPLMRSIIRYDDPEMFTVLGLLIVMLTGLATASAGLSLTLGAFLAGMVLAETPFRVLLQTELRPFRSLLLALFFITVGMMLDPSEIMANAPVVLSILAVIVCLKAALIGALMFVFKRRNHHIIQLSFLLAQGSEFAFVIFSMASVETALGATLTQELIAAVALSMLLTPLFSTLANKFGLKLCDVIDGPISNCPDGERSPVAKQPVFIIGMNEIGKTLARGFRAHKMPYIAVDHDRQRFLQATAAGYIVAYGRADDLRFWNSLGVSKARALCVASPRYDVAKEVTPIVKRIYPDLKRYVAVEDSAEGVRYATLGMTPFYNKGMPPGLEMACFVLRDLGLSEEEIQPWTDEEHSAWLESNKSTIGEEEAIADAS